LIDCNDSMSINWYHIFKYLLIVDLVWISFNTFSRAIAFMFLCRKVRRYQRGNQKP